MSHPKVTVIGAGNVGATTAQRIAEAGLADVVLVDIVEGLPQGKALDLAEAAPVAGPRLPDHRHERLRRHGRLGHRRGHLSGLARQPGMSRDDLLAKNAGIVRSVVQQARAALARTRSSSSSPTRSTRCATSRCEASGFPPERVIGMAGVLDSARFRTFIAAELGVSVTSTHAFVLGGHGDTMVPLPRYSHGRRRAAHGAAHAGADRGARRPHAQRRRRDRGAAQDRQRLLRPGRVGVRRWSTPS